MLNLGEENATHRSNDGGQTRFDSPIAHRHSHCFILHALRVQDGKCTLISQRNSAPLRSSLWPPFSYFWHHTSHKYTPHKYSQCPADTRTTQTPFTDKVDDWLSFLTSLQLMLTLLVGFALMSDDPKDPDYDSTDWGTLDVVLILINSVAFVALLCSIIMLHPKIRERFEKAEAPNLNTKVVPAAQPAASQKADGVSGLRDWN